MALGVHKTILKKRNKEGLLKQVVDFLKSDSDMFAPLFSSQTFNFSSANTSTTGVETEKNIDEVNKKKLLEKVGNYLKSDCYMYAPLLVPQSSLSATTKRANTVAHGVVPLGGENIDQPQGASLYLKRVTTATSAEKITKKKNQPIKQTANITRTSAHKEMVKQMVHQNCRSSSVPGKGRLETEQRKVLIE